MRRVLRSTVSTALAIALFAAVPWPASAEAPGDTISATEPSSYDLPEGGTVVFNPTDPAGTGATVDVATLETSGATAATADGTVTAIGDGVDVSATSPTGEDITSLQHEVTIIPGTEDQPATDEMTPAIELTFPVSAADIAGIDPATLGVYSRESADDPWTWVPSAYDSDLGAVVAQSDHLSEFTVMGAPAVAASACRPPGSLLDPDDLVGGRLERRPLQRACSSATSVATSSQDELVDECSTRTCLITRDASSRRVARRRARTSSRNFERGHRHDARLQRVQLVPRGTANDAPGARADGGIVAWSANNAASTGLANTGQDRDREVTRAARTRAAVNPTDCFAVLCVRQSVPGTYAARSSCCSSTTTTTGR